jgi:hypothetical protein
MKQRVFTTMCLEVVRMCIPLRKKSIYWTIVVTKFYFCLVERSKNIRKKQETILQL